MWWIQNFDYKESPNCIIISTAKTCQNGSVEYSPLDTLMTKLMANVLHAHIIFLCREIRVDHCLVEEKVMENGFWLALLAGDMDAEDQIFLVFTRGCQTLFPGFINTYLLFCNSTSWILTVIYVICYFKKNGEIINKIRQPIFFLEQASHCIHSLFVKKQRDVFYSLVNCLKYIVIFILKHQRTIDSDMEDILDNVIS